MIVPGSSYWNIGVANKKGEIEKDAEALETMDDARQKHDLAPQEAESLGLHVQLDAGYLLFLVDYVHHFGEACYPS